MSMRKTIKRILREETQMPIQVRRRVDIGELDDLVDDINRLIDSGYSSKMDAIYDTVRQFIASNRKFKFDSNSEQDYWDRYTKYEIPIVDYLKKKLKIKDDINESASIKLRRRINLENFDKEFERALRACSTILEKKKQFLKAMTAEKFVSQVVSYMVTNLCETQNCNDVFDELWDYLSDRYNEQIAKKYFEVRYGRIIESKLMMEMRPYKVMRRTNLIDDEIRRLLLVVYDNERICERYDDADMFVRVVTEAVVENLYFKQFYMMDDTSEEWEKSVDFIYDYIKDSYGVKIRNHYNKMCNK
jgi:hypothetical protein